PNYYWCISWRSGACAAAVAHPRRVNFNFTDIHDNHDNLCKPKCDSLRAADAYRSAWHYLYLQLTGALTNSTAGVDGRPLRARVPRMAGIGRRAILADRRARGIVGVEPVVAVGA